VLFPSQVKLHEKRSLLKAAEAKVKNLLLTLMNNIS